jgi:DNA invertase Pin-like site-specific DNA recombinase
MQMAVRDALIGFRAATAQAQAEATKEAQRAGIEHAKANGESYRGRSQAIAATTPCRTCLARAPTSSRSRRRRTWSRQTVYRIKDDPAAAEAALATWEA